MSFARSIRLGGREINLKETVLEALGKPAPVDWRLQRQLLAEFYQDFERLSDLICDAARCGNGAPFQAAYSEVRADLMHQFPAIQPHLIAHIDCDPTDVEIGMQFAGRPTDAVEALFVSESLQDVIDSDGGGLMNRLIRARSGLFRYGDHLRSLTDD